MILNYFNIVLHLGFYQNRKVKYNKLVQRLFEKSILHIDMFILQLKIG